jgi:hypothetical protein
MDAALRGSDVNNGSIEIEIFVSWSEESTHFKIETEYGATSNVVFDCSAKSGR